MQLRVCQKISSCFFIVLVFFTTLTTVYSTSVASVISPDAVILSRLKGFEIDAKLVGAKLVVEPDFLQLSRKVMVCNPIDVPPKEKNPFLSIAAHYGLTNMLTLFGGRNAVVGRIVGIDGNPKNVIVITGLGPKYNSKEREQLERAIGAEIYDVIDVIEAEYKLGKNFLRDLIYSFVKGTLEERRQTLAHLREAGFPETVINLSNENEALTGLCKLLMKEFGEMFSYQMEKEVSADEVFNYKQIGGLSRKLKLKFLLDLICTAKDVQKDLSGMVSGNSALELGRAVHSEMLYISLCELNRWKNLYFFTQRDMCPWCEENVQLSLRTLNPPPAPTKLLVLSAIESHQTGGVAASGVNGELYSYNDGWIMTGIGDNLPDYLYDTRSLMKLKHTKAVLEETLTEQFKTVFRVRIPLLGAVEKPLAKEPLVELEYYPQFEIVNDSIGFYDRIIYKGSLYPYVIPINIGDQIIEVARSANGLKSLPYTMLKPFPPAADPISAALPPAPAENPEKPSDTH